MCTCLWYKRGLLKTCTQSDLIIIDREIHRIYHNQLNTVCVVGNLISIYAYQLHLLIVMMKFTPVVICVVCGLYHS